MTARWDDLPDSMKAKAAPAKRRAVRRGRWLCGPCDTWIEGTWASMERHVDAHGGGRITCGPQPATLESTTTTTEGT